MSRQQPERQYVHTWETIKKLLNEPRYYAAIEKAAAHTTKPVVSPDDAIRAIVGCVVDNPYLGKCAELSFVFAAIQSIRTGLPIGKPLDLAYLVPRWNKSVGSVWTYFTPSYMGLMTVARRSGDVPAIYGKVVRENDAFSYREGTRPEIDHVPATRDRGAITHAYAVAHLTGSPVPVFAVLDLEEINKRRAISDALKRDANDKNSWDKWESEMSVKSAVVALSHFLPRSPEFGFALFAEQQFATDELDHSLVGELGAIIDQKMLPATGAQAVDVEERIAARAAELVAAKASPAPAAPLAAEIPPPERTEIGDDAARALEMTAANVHGNKHVAEWKAETLARYGVDDLRFLAPSEERTARECLERALRHQSAN